MDPIIEKLQADSNNCRRCSTCGGIEVLLANLGGYEGTWHCESCYSGQNKPDSNGYKLDAAGGWQVLPMAIAAAAGLSMVAHWKVGTTVTMGNQRHRLISVPTRDPRGQYDYEFKTIIDKTKMVFYFRWNRGKQRWQCTTGE